MNDISKDKDYQEFFAGIKELAKGLMQIRERAAILLMYKKVCRRFVYDYPETISYYIMEYRKEYDRESLIGTEYEYLLHEDDDLYDENCKNSL